MLPAVPFYVYAEPQQTRPAHRKPFRSPAMSRRHLGQQISFVMAIVSGLGAAIMVAVAAWLVLSRGAGDVFSASALAGVAFLASCAVVLWVMSRPQPPLPKDHGAGD
jgi:CHASE2 domain-containing sensor protein